MWREEADVVVHVWMFSVMSKNKHQQKKKIINWQRVRTHLLHRRHWNWGGKLPIMPHAFSHKDTRPVWQVEGQSSHPPPAPVLDQMGEMGGMVAVLSAHVLATGTGRRQPSLFGVPARVGFCTSGVRREWMEVSLYLVRVKRPWRSRACSSWARRRRWEDAVGSRAAPGPEDGRQRWRLSHDLN